MTRRLILILALLAGAFFIGGMPVAHAAPGDCLATGPIVTYLPDGTPVRAVICEPYPPDPDPERFIYTVCTDLPPVNGLPRKECQDFRTVTNEPYGEPQIFTYDPPGCGSSCGPAVTPTPSESRPPYTPVTAGNNENDDDPLSPHPAPRTITRTQTVTAAPETVTEVVAAPAPTMPTPTRTGTAPRTSKAPNLPDLTSAEDREGWLMTVSNGTLYGIAAVAGLVFLAAMLGPGLVRRYRPGVHQG